MTEPEPIPTHQEFQDFLNDECPKVLSKRPDLYEALSSRNWTDRRWRRIHDWRQYVLALEEFFTNH